MFKVYQKAAQLPVVWNEIAGDNIFLHKDMLERLEAENPCHQSYHLNEVEMIILVSYKLKLNLLTFTKNFSLKLPVNIVGVPMSVAKSGYAFGDPGKRVPLSQKSKSDDLNGQHNVIAFSSYVKSLQGFWLLLNADHHLNLSQGQTLPTCKLELSWESFEAYLASMRSHYRYRLTKALQKFSAINVAELEDNSSFDEEMYKLYLNVYERSQEKLEKLPIGFFKTFPAKLLKFTLNGDVVAFLQLAKNDEELIFLFGGFQHSLNQKYDLYLNMLLQIVSYGLSLGVKRIDFGQTSEETKLKLGAVQEPKYLYVHHSNGLINTVLNKLVGKFSYRPYPISHKVFKELWINKT